MDYADRDATLLLHWDRYVLATKERQRLRRLGLHSRAMASKLRSEGNALHLQGDEACVSGNVRIEEGLRMIEQAKALDASLHRDILLAQGHLVAVEGEQQRAEGYRLKASGDARRAEGNMQSAEGAKYFSCADQVHAEAELAWAQAVLRVRGPIAVTWHESAPTDGEPQAPGPAEAVRRNGNVVVCVFETGERFVA